MHLLVKIFSSMSKDESAIYNATLITIIDGDIWNLSTGTLKSIKCKELETKMFNLVFS